MSGGLFGIVNNGIGGQDPTDPGARGVVGIGQPSGGRGNSLNTAPGLGISDTPAASLPQMHSGQAAAFQPMAGQASGGQTFMPFGQQPVGQGHAVGPAPWQLSPGDVPFGQLPVGQGHAIGPMPSQATPGQGFGHAIAKALS